MSLINCMIDPKKYSEKPKDKEYSAKHMGHSNTIDARIKRSSYHQLTDKELADHIGKGQVYLPGHLISRKNSRSKDNMQNINTFSLDIDNDNGTKYTELEVIEKLEVLLGVTPFMYYQTFSGENEDGSKRFRLLYKINGIVDPGDFEILMQYIMDNTEDMLDQACKQSNRLFNGTNRKVEVYEGYSSLDVGAIEDIVLEEEKRKESLKLQQEQDRLQRAKKLKAMGYDPSYSENVIEEINSQDMRDYLCSAGVELDRSMRAKCPLHNGNNKSAFTIYQQSETWLYKCFSCGNAGNLIQLHQELNNLDFKEALEELKGLYNIQEQPSPRATQVASMKDIVCKIDKYIGKDRKATETIIETLDRNKKILITGSMACGKTTFVIRDVKEYAQALSKVVIMVIPGVKQLENLNENQGVSIVYGKMPVYMGADLVATTPESLLKVTGEVGAGKYVLVVDESHERYSSLYRHGYRDRNIETAELEAFKVIHMTATPRLLVHDSFEKVISIETKESISNSITIFKVKDKLDDNMLSMVDKSVEASIQPTLFNNNKEMNEAFSEMIGVKEKVITAELKDGQLDLLKEDTKTYETEERTLVSTETVQSGKKSENVAKGQILADATFTTSSITAGVDLYTRENATLIINTDGVGLDNVIQLIGRFRNGINVIIVIRDNENKRKCFNLYEATMDRIADSKELARIINTNKRIKRLSESKEALRQSAHLELSEDGGYTVNETKVIADVYEEWSKAVYDNPNELIRLLKEQTAFTVKDIRVAKFNDKEESRVSELKKESQEKQKRVREKTSKELLDKSDETLQRLLTNNHQGLKDETIEVFKQYEAVSERHLEQIRTTANKLLTSESGVKDLAGAFRKFQNQSWASIQREIARVEAREINRLIKEHGVETYLKVKNLRHKKAIDVVQARIRHEFNDIEKKQGRITKKRLDELVGSLIAENYIYNKKVKIYKDKDIEEKDREKAFQDIGQDIGKLLENIYNFDSEGKLQSPKI